MPNPRCRLRASVALSMLCTLAAPGHGQNDVTEAPAAPSRQDPEPTAPFPRQGEYTGLARCLECHDKRRKELQAGHHGGILAAGLDGCETCHGPAKAHSDDPERDPLLITHPQKLPAHDLVAACRRCHADVDPQRFHWRGRHKPLLSHGATCVTCHTIHAPRTPEKPAPDAEAKATNRACFSCHAPAACVLTDTVHGTLGRLDAPLQQGCGACHAGGLAHAQAGGKKDLVESMHGSSAARQLQVCGQCHGHEDALRQVRLGSHHRHEVGCLECHAPAAARGRVAEDAERKCTSCHADVAAEFRLPNHHPVPEGRMLCTDCHAVHRARPRIRDRELREDSCVRCHPQYRGPFVFAHQASRQDGCVICHAPHGSPNRRLMHQATTQQNCLQCHGDFPSFHDQTPGALFTVCIRCHTEVHGSNHSRFLLR